jgi:uncharacterized protein
MRSSTSFVVCKLRADSAIPKCVAESKEFVSITRTPDELSIVGPSSLLSQVQNTAVVEKDWTMFKVAGPLDFGLTGILASIATPLADSNVSIFAISTYDTDYVLVKESARDEAISALEKVGHRIV